MTSTLLSGLLAISLLTPSATAKPIRGRSVPVIEAAFILPSEGKRVSIKLKASSSLYLHDTKPVVVLSHPRFLEITLIQDSGTIELKLKEPVHGFTNVFMPLPLFSGGEEVGSLTAIKNDPLRYILKIDSALVSGVSHISLSKIAQIQTKAEQGSAHQSTTRSESKSK